MQTGRRTLRLTVGTLMLAGGISLPADVAAQRRGPQTAPVGPATLGLDQGTIEIDTPDFALKLVRASQTIASLEPKTAGGFDFTPADQLAARSADGYHHLGDLTLRLRVDGAAAWTSFSTAAARKPVEALPVSGAVLAAADLAPTLPDGLPVRIVREWVLDGGKLVLRFDVKNTSGSVVQIGALGIPLIFNNYITGRSLEQAHAVCSFSDPAIGLDGGYVQVTRLNGKGPALVVVPDGKSPLEAYNPLLDDPTQRTQTFEGFYEWMIHSQAYAENEWKGVRPWNPPTVATLAPGEERSYGLTFLLSDSIRGIEDTLAGSGRPVTVGVPGYVLPMDLVGRLYLKYPHGVESVEVTPAGAIAVTKRAASPAGWAAYELRGKTWGRARLTVSYADGTRQSIHYRVIKPAGQAVADLGRFLTGQQWFVDPDDPFRRSPSVMSYDRELNRIVTQDSRVWIAGLGDEGGSGSWLACAMKLLGQPEPSEIGKYQQFIDGVLWGGLQYSDGPQAFGVRKSLFFYAPDEMPPGYYDDSFDWTSWTSWSRAKTEVVDRSFNYPHAVAAYWVFYRLARNNVGLVSNHPWDWYLTRAYETSLAMVRLAPYYARFGQMEGDVFLELLRDLQREGWTAQAEQLEATMRKRVERWRSEAYPFGSEMAWDSTGQEEVYAWTKHFGYDDKAQVTLDAILGYMPTIPHWGYNGNARRYWDFLYGGKLRERQIHHYGSSLNALPVLSAYRDRPEDFHLLRVGYGGMLGVLSNIDQEGFASAAFHAWPQTLAFDPYSGDYGPGFLGHALGTATYVVKHPQLGWLAFGGNLELTGGIAEITPLDSFRSRLYVAPLGLWLTLDSGRFETVAVDLSSQTVRVDLAPATTLTPQALLRIEQPAAVEGVGRFAPAEALDEVRGGYRVPLGASVTSLTLRPAPAQATAGSTSGGWSATRPASSQQWRSTP